MSGARQLRGNLDRSQDVPRSDRLADLGREHPAGIGPLVARPTAQPLDEPLRIR